MAASGFAANHLRSFVNRIERMNEEIAAATADRKEIYAEAKATGFDTTILRQVIAIRKLDAADYQERCALIDTYLSALQINDAPTREAMHEVMRDEPSEQAGAH